MRFLLRGFIGGGFGAGIGGFLGVVFAYGMAALSVAMHPDDPSAGSVAIIVIGTLPLGVLIGAVVGFVAGVRNKALTTRLPETGRAPFDSKEAFENWLSAADN